MDEVQVAAQAVRDAESSEERGKAIAKLREAVEARDAGRKTLRDIPIMA